MKFKYNMFFTMHKECQSMQHPSHLILGLDELQMNFSSHTDRNRLALEGAQVMPISVPRVCLCSCSWKRNTLFSHVYLMSSVITIYWGNWVLSFVGNVAQPVNIPYDHCEEPFHIHCNHACISHVFHFINFVQNVCIILDVRLQVWKNRLDLVLNEF